MSWERRGHPDLGFGYGRAKRIGRPHLAAHPLEADIAASVFMATSLPDEVDNDDLVIDVLDQLRRGACVQHGAGQAARMVQVAAGVPKEQALLPCRAAGDWLCRRDDGLALADMGQDTGTFLATLADVWEKFGFASDSLVPYGDSPDDIKRPPTQLYMGAAIDQSGLFGKTKTLLLTPPASNDDTLMAAVDAGVANRKPFVWAGMISNAFAENAFDASVAIDACPPGDIDGGHAICGPIGYRTRADGTREYRYVNSWGRDFGLLGFFWAKRPFVLSRVELRALTSVQIEGSVWS